MRVTNLVMTIIMVLHIMRIMIIYFQSCIALLLLGIEIIT